MISVTEQIISRVHTRTRVCGGSARCQTATYRLDFLYRRDQSRWSSNQTAAPTTTNRALKPCVRALPSFIVSPRLTRFLSKKKEETKRALEGNSTQRFLGLLAWIIHELAVKYTYCGSPRRCPGWPSGGCQLLSQTSHENRYECCVHTKSEYSQRSSLLAWLFVAFRVIRALEGAGLISVALLRGNSYRLLHPPWRTHH